MAIIKGKHYPYGIRVSGRKTLTKAKPIENLPPEEYYVISLSQHIGAPAKPVVAVGDKVKRGQIIAEAGGFISAPVYSGVSGEVVAIDNKPTVNGAPVTHVTVKNDFQNETVFLPPMKDKSPASIIERIREAGIVGLGGAGFPTAVKLAPKEKVDTLIINGAECEPYLTCDYRLMLERKSEILEGIKLLKTALGVDRVLIGIEENKPDCIEEYGHYDDFDVVTLQKQYPMGSEKHLIYCCTGRKVGLGALPASVGCVVQNIKTTIAVHEAVNLNIPLYESVVTVSGNGIVNPKNVRTPFGTSYKSLISYCGGTTDNVVKYVAGGPMMGRAAITLDLYTKKTDSGILALEKGEANVLTPTNCIRCGRCSDNCPMRLIPVLMDFHIQGGDYEGAEKLGVMNCLECGSCAYNCPAKRPLTQSFNFAKAKIKEMHAKESK